MLVKLILLFLFNFSVTVAKNESNTYNEIGIEKFDTTSVQGHRNPGEKTFREQLFIDKRSASSEASDSEEEFNEDDQYYDSYDYEYDYSEPKETAHRGKRAAIETDIPPNKFIVRGKQSNIDAYPWMVYLNIVIRGMHERGTSRSSCGGTLLNSKYVVTAAHCVNFKFNSLNDIQVILAEYDIRTFPWDCVQYSDGNQQCINNVKMFPEHLVIHEWYNNNSIVNDIALLRLRGKAPNTKFIHPIPLPTYDIDKPRNSGVKLTVTGWGNVHEKGPSPPVRLDTTVNMLSFSECRRITPVPEGKLCALGNRGQDSCYGDSGSPLMAKHQGNYFLVGIVSGKQLTNGYHPDCGSRIPTTYTNVYKYLNWIKYNMRP